MISRQGLALDLLTLDSWNSLQQVVLEHMHILMEMISKLGLLARALLLSSLGLCTSRSSLGLAALRSPGPGVFRFSVRFLHIALGEARSHLNRQTAL